MGWVGSEQSLLIVHSTHTPSVILQAGFGAAQSPFEWQIGATSGGDPSLLLPAAPAVPPVPLVPAVPEVPPPAVPATPAIPPSMQLGELQTHVPFAAGERSQISPDGQSLVELQRPGFSDLLGQAAPTRVTTKRVK